MLSPAKSRRLDAPVAVSLEDLVPANHFYRHLEPTLDLDFVRGWACEQYADHGQPSIDPVLDLLQPVAFSEGIRASHRVSSFLRWHRAR
jgi:hypothetical protein